MTTKYTSVIYSNINMEYTFKLCKHIKDVYYKKSGKILDVGCGKGIHVNCFEKLGMNSHGIDIRKETNNKKIKICDVENDVFPYKDNTFDFIFSKSVIEHIIRPDNFLKECHRVIKQNGVIVIMTPDWKSQMKSFWDDYSHYHAWTKKSLKDALLIFGFERSKCKYFLQLPYTWKYPRLGFISKIISLLPDSTKWKTSDMRNGKDRKFIRFSKEKMLLGVGYK